MKKLFCLLAFSLFLLGCEKDRSLECIDSIVFWGGDPAVDGLGWYVSPKRGSAYGYLVDNLPAEFQVDSIPVRVCLTETNKKRNCFCESPRPVYRIKAISKR